MSSEREDRAVSTLVGAVLLFAFIFLIVALWQSQVVPQQNAEIEFTHHLAVQDDLVEVRNTLVGAASGSALSPVAIDMAPEYPARTIFINPAPPQGTLRTIGTTDEAIQLVISNASASNEEVADFWTGADRSYNTGVLEYETQYDQYRNAPRSTYDNSVLYNHHDGGVTVTVVDQAMIRDRTISLVMLNGSLHRNQARTYSLDFESLSSSTRRIAITDDAGDPITITFATRRNASYWNQSFAETGELRAQGGQVADVRSDGTVDGFNLVTVELEPDTTYNLELALVGVGTQTTTPQPTYVIDVRGDGSYLLTGESRELVVEVRDRFNNPVSGVAVENDSSSDLLGGTLDAETKTTDANGRASFVFTSAENGTASITFNISDDATVTDAELVTFAIDVRD